MSRLIKFSASPTASAANCRIEWHDLPDVEGGLQVLARLLAKTVRPLARNEDAHIHSSHLRRFTHG